MKRCSTKHTIALILGFLLFAGGTVFADEEIPLPKNTIIIDVGQTAFLLLLTGIMNTNPDNEAYAFGIATQYERQITERTSAALRFEYGVFDMSDVDLKWNMSSFSAQGHGRFYPTQGVFF